MEVLEDRPQLDAVARHQAHGPFDRRQMAESGELIQEIQNGRDRLARCACQILQTLDHHQSQPAGIGGEPVRRQDEEHGGGAALQITKIKIRMIQRRRHARAVEKVGMALGG